MPKLILNKAEVQAKTALTMLYSFLTLLVINVFVVYIANQLFPADVVLGTFALTPWWAAFLSMGILTIVTVFAIPFVYYHEWKRNKNYSSKEWMLLYFVVNSVAVWVISRFADNLGLGISHWWVAVLLAVALDWAQGIAMLGLSKLQQG